MEEKWFSECKSGFKPGNLRVAQSHNGGYLWAL